MITVNLTAQGGTNLRELTVVQLYTQLYHSWVVCFQLFQLTLARGAFGINLISCECVFKQGKLSNCQSRNRRSVAVTKDTNNLAICFQDISSDTHICEGQNSQLDETAASCFTKTLSCCTSKRHFVTATQAHATRRTVLHSVSMIFLFHDNLSLFQNSPASRSPDRPFQMPTLWNLGCTRFSRKGSGMTCQCFKVGLTV